MLAGVAVGVMVSLALMGGDAASATKVLNARNTSDLTTCAAPSGGAGGGAGNVLGAQTTAAVNGGKGAGEEQGGGNTFVHKLVGGGMNTSTATISGNGNGSVNTVTTTNTNTTNISNHNDVTVENKNVQKAYSGDAEVEDNYSGGSATSGDAWNTNSTTTNISISN
jgi:hypothetical protein